MAATLPQRRLALAVIVLLGAAIFVTAPFAAVPMVRADTFIPGYKSALIVEDCDRGGAAMDVLPDHRRLSGRCAVCG